MNNDPSHMLHTVLPWVLLILLGLSITVLVKMALPVAIPLVLVGAGLYFLLKFFGGGPGRRDL